jgi:hypothetical protein
MHNQTLRTCPALVRGSRPDFVAAASTLPGVPRIRLPPTSPHRYDGKETKVFHLHSNKQRLVAHHRQFDTLPKWFAKSRCSTPTELALLNEIWELDRVFTNYLLPQQKLVFKQRNGAKVTKRYYKAMTPHQRAIGREDMRKRPIIRMNA